VTAGEKDVNDTTKVYNHSPCTGRRQEQTGADISGGTGNRPVEEILSDLTPIISLLPYNGRGLVFAKLGRISLYQESQVGERLAWVTNADADACPAARKSRSIEMSTRCKTSQESSAARLKEETIFIQMCW
jgi:hypothetical protein